MYLVQDIISTWLDASTTINVHRNTIIALPFVFINTFLTSNTYSNFCNVSVVLNLNTSNVTCIWCSKALLNGWIAQQ